MSSDVLRQQAGRGQSIREMREERELKLLWHKANQLHELEKKPALYTRCSHCGTFAQVAAGTKCKECGDGVMV